MKYIDHHNSNIHLAEEVDARERDPFGNACTWNVRHIYTLDGHNHWGQPGRARGGNLTDRRIGGAGGWNLDDDGALRLPPPP